MTLEERVARLERLHQDAAQRVDRLLQLRQQAEDAERAVQAAYAAQTVPLGEFECLRAVAESARLEYNAEQGRYLREEVALYRQEGLLETEGQG